MTQSALKPCVAFDGHTLIGSGPLAEVALVVKRAIEAGAEGPVLIFDDGDGRVIDVDTRGTDAEIVERLSPAVEARGRGRPKLGVVAREVTLLPRHWDWLAAQPGGASAAVRRLVEDARRVHADRDRARQARDGAYRVMSALAGDLPGFEEASRALFANDRAKFADQVAGWPVDVRNYVVSAAFADVEAGGMNATATTYLQPSEAAGRAFFSRRITGELVMLNLLRFRGTADYSSTPELAPPRPISGAEAFDLYIAHTLPHLASSNGELLFLGDGGAFLIGPPDERWDMAMLVRQKSAEAFLAFASNPAYLTGLGHRTAALEDSRLLPLIGRAV